MAQRASLPHVDPTVVAAIIAGALTVIGTLAAQYFGGRATQKTLKNQGEQLDKTLEEQRTRTLNERFATAASQLGSDKPPTVQLAGAYAMAGLADDWQKNRQTCVDVLCGYLRMPYEPDPGEESPEKEQVAFRASREVRHTVIRIITAHLKEGAAVSWQGLDLDFTGAVFDGGDFIGARFSGSTVSFNDAEFSGGEVRFYGAEFSGSTVGFYGARFSGGTVYFGARFSGGRVHFDRARFSGSTVSFGDALFSGGEVYFNSAEFSGSTVVFDGAEFSGSRVYFGGTRFSSGTVYFGARFSRSSVSFFRARFSGGTVSFGGAEFSGGTIGFVFAEFSGGTVGFGELSRDEISLGDDLFSGLTPGLGDAEFSGGEVDFSTPGDWSFPPAFPWTGTPPPGVNLPEIGDQSQA
jgi:uncharacterized protein YjbI with pentapeptide repeats